MAISCGRREFAKHCRALRSVGSDCPFAPGLVIEAMPRDTMRIRRSCAASIVLCRCRAERPMLAWKGTVFASLADLVLRRSEHLRVAENQDFDASHVVDCSAA